MSKAIIAALLAVGGYYAYQWWQSSQRITEYGTVNDKGEYQAIVAVADPADTAVPPVQINIPPNIHIQPGVWRGPHK